MRASPDGATAGGAPGWPPRVSYRTTLTGDGVTWELDLAKKPDLAERVASLNRNLVVVEGTLKMIKGTEILTRWIVIVERLPAAESP